MEEKFKYIAKLSRDNVEYKVKDIVLLNIF